MQLLVKRKHYAVQSEWVDWFVWIPIAAAAAAAAEWVAQDRFHNLFIYLSYCLNIDVFLMLLFLSVGNLWFIWLVSLLWIRSSFIFHISLHLVHARRHSLFSCIVVFSAFLDSRVQKFNCFAHIFVVCLNDLVIVFRIWFISQSNSINSILR